MSLEAYLTILALVTGPIIAVLISIWIQNRKEKRQNQMNVFSTLIIHKYNQIGHENIQALNLVDIVFKDNKEVRKLRKELFDLILVDNKELEDARKGQIETKRKELIQEMAKVLGYKVSILDFDKIFFPVGMAEQIQRNDAILNELHRVLKETKAIPVIPPDKPPLR